MNATRKVKLKDITSNLTCHLCKGYFIDATTIIECLHSFCKSCIVKHLENNEYCPVCEVQLHSTKPLSSIRSDQMLQEIVYKLVPGLFRKEMARRREFYHKHPECITTCQMDSGQVFNQFYITSDDIIHISLEYFTDDVKFRENSKRFLKCPAAVSISILKKLIQGKYDTDAHIDVMYGEQKVIQPDDFLLMDIAYKYSWTNSDSKPLQLSYRVKGMLPPALSPPLSRTPSTVPLSKRRSRNSAETISRSEILKSSNRNLQVDNNSRKQTPTTPKLTPNERVKGKRKRNQTMNNEVQTVESKRQKSCKYPITKEIECQSEGPIPIMSNVTPVKVEKEVQLQISENGVISAKSVFSGEEKIIMSLEKPPSKPPPLSTVKQELLNNAIAVESVSTETEQQNVSSSSCVSIVPKITAVTSKSNYVRLNIPTISISNSNSTNNNDSGPNLKKPINGNVGGSPSAKISIPPPAQKISPSKRKQPETHSHKIPNGFAPNSNTTNFDNKIANVQKALMDLQKNYTSSKGNSNPPLPTSGGTGSANNIVADLKSFNNLTQPLQTNLNGIHIQNPFPFQLSSLAASGMTVNLIPATNANVSAETGKKLATNSSPPPKRIAHHTTVVNGDLKFTTSPRHILPSPCKISNGSGPSEMSSPKKPPKFFKSRHSSTISSDGESPSKKEKSQTKKMANQNGNSCPNVTFNSNSIFSSCLNGASTTTTPSGATTTSQSLGIKPSSSQAQPLNAFNQIMNYWNPLQFNIAGASSSLNNLTTALVPFGGTGEYIPISFPNSRSLYSMNSIPNISFPFSYQGLANGGSFSQANNSCETTTSYTSKNGDTQVSSSQTPRISSAVNSGAIRDNGFLDLSMKKEKASHREPLSLKKTESCSTSTSVTVTSVNSNTSVLSIESPLSLVSKIKKSLPEPVAKKDNHQSVKNQTPIVCNENTEKNTITEKVNDLASVNTSEKSHQSSESLDKKSSNIDSTTINNKNSSNSKTSSTDTELTNLLVQDNLSKLENPCLKSMNSPPDDNILCKKDSPNSNPVIAVNNKEISDIHIETPLPPAENKLLEIKEKQLIHKLSNGDHPISNGKLLVDSDLVKIPITCNNNNNNNSPPDNVIIKQNLSSTGA